MSEKELETKNEVEFVELLSVEKILKKLNRLERPFFLRKWLGEREA